MSALSSILSPIGSRGYVLIVCFLDDSGKESQPTMPSVCMAGYFAGSDTIAELTNKWEQLLLRHGIPGIHMRELIHLSGVYENLNWDLQKRDTVLNEFIDVIREESLVGVGIAVKMSAWRDAVKKYPDVRFGSVQEFCLQRILRRIVDRLHAAKIDDHAVLFFDRDQEFAANRISLTNAIIAHDPRARALLAAVTFANPWLYPGLQCADILAWETRKEMIQKMGGHQSTKRWIKIFTAMPQYHLDYIGELWDEEIFEANLPEIRRASLPSSA
jgi:hypothetical protein